MSITQDAKRVMDAINKKNETSEIFVYGTITNVSPLLVYVSDRLSIPGNFITLSALARPSPFWRGLQPGDAVVMLSDGKGENYHILERLGMEITHDTSDF